ncbi:MAG: lipoprotein-releasing ABC transporter permease subunit [Desulfobacterales bacterium]|nr:lipoprotein-releasing ABC transporter permease subunit [Desulfobacterales bacterium]
MSLERFICGRYLVSKQRQAFISITSLLSMAGVAVGVMALIVVIAVMAGFEEDLRTRIIGVQSHVVIQGKNGTIAEYANVERRIAGMAEVAATTPFALTQVMLRAAGGTSGAVLRGIDPVSAGRVMGHLGAEELGQLRKRPPGARPGIILGKELARQLGLVEGDMVSLISPRGMISPVGHIPSMRRFEVVGRFESGVYEYDGTLAYVHLTQAQKLMRLGNAVTGIEVHARDMDQAGRIAETIRKMFGPGLRVQDWTEMNRTLFSALKLEKTAMFVILTLIVLVAAFNIASSLIMLVMEKTRDVAILKAMGATDRSIRRIFMLNGMAIGAVGTLLGAGSGIVVCLLLARYKFVELPRDVYYITTLPVRLDIGDVTAIALAALVICLLATIYPACQAAKLNPVEAIRYG